MSTLECPREQEVVAMVLEQRWPEAAPEELQEHVETCDLCGDVVTVANILSHDHYLARRDVQVPASGQVWWRAAVRARLEAVHAAARPMTWLHGVAGACAAGLALAALTVLWPSIVRSLTWIATRVARVDVDPGAADVAAVLTAAIQQSLPLVLTVTACIIIAPIAVYFALSDDK